jgi:hypothetical protein
MTSQESSVSRDAKRLDLKAKCLDVDVGDKVWVMFPNVGTGRSRKLAFRMHGTYVVRKWLHGAKRVAVVGHQDDENDVMLVHVDRMVRKKELSQKLQKEWKPIKLNLVHQNMAKRQEKADAANAKKQSVAEDDKLKRVLAEVDPEVAKEIEKELDDEDYRIEHILSHRMRQGKREFKVKFVGYGPDHNLWYWEKDLRETTPEMVDEYLAEKGEQTQKAPKSRAVAQPKKSKAKRANKLKTGV